MERVKQLIERYKHRSKCDRLGDFDDDEWLCLEQDLKEYWLTASDEEKHMLDGSIPMESFYMVCSGIRWERNKKKINIDQSIGWSFM